jgi:hypothetical protein
LASAAVAFAAPERRAVASALAFKAPLFDRILAAPANPERRSVVLDLGAISRSMLDLLSSKWPCRIEIADLARFEALPAIERIVSSEDQDPDAIEAFLPAENGERLDLIFCWDLPNYLSLPALSLLIDALSRRAAPGCRLHMLIAYSKSEMASAPGRYIPAADGTLQQVLSSDQLIQAPRYSPEDISTALGNFRYQRGVLLANGMQEFVYAWPGEPGERQP